VSFTLRGRVESRLAAAIVAAFVAAAFAAGLREWWPLELAGVMTGVGLALDAAIYDRLLPYQPGWLALPLGAGELGATIALARLADVPAPLAGGIALFAFAWLVAQVLVHAALPLLHRSYGDDGGELGAAGAALVVVGLGLLAGSGGVAWATRPPLYHLARGAVRGPLVLDRPGIYEGAGDTVVRGGVLVRASGVTVRRLRVEGGENGIDVEDARNVVLERVTVVGAALDGIHVRRSEVAVHDCVVRSPRGAYTQGIDISFGLEQPTSLVEGCTVTGGAEGIVTHYANAMVERNRVSGTSLRGITLTEMSMGMAERNAVDGATGIGILCGDHSECELAGNRVSAVRPDRASQDPTRMGYAIVSQFGAEAELHGRLAAGRTGAFLGGTIVRR
jgi:parallel beta helix pectate lyase-like protein